MSTDENAQQLLKQYKKMFDMFVAHMNECPKLEKKVIEGFEFEDE